MPKRARTHKPFGVTRQATRRYENKIVQAMYNARWQRYSKQRLKAHPLCVRCQEQWGCVRAARVTDHTIPHKGDERLFWLESNHQSLCKECHDIKTATEDGGFGNRMRIRAYEGGQSEE